MSKMIKKNERTKTVDKKNVNKKSVSSVLKQSLNDIIKECTKLEDRKKKLSEVDVTKDVKTFSIFPLSRKTQFGLKEAGFVQPTRIQKHSLVHLLQGKDVVAAAKTGSGKTLAFIISLLETLFCERWSSEYGLGAIVITPTRELAYQIYEVLHKVGKYHNLSAGLIIGGKDLRYEWSRIGHCNIVICTPGRLLQHMTENPDFFCHDLKLLILDEADMCLSMGFADTMGLILQELPKNRQTMLFSATQTKDVNDLIRAGCRNPVMCNVHDNSKTITPQSLKESYVLCETHDKMKFLWSFVKCHKKHKILVFFATCKQVKFMYEVFHTLLPSITFLHLHGAMHQLRRMAVYDHYCALKQAVLFATDVAARGLDIPCVDWVMQLDCPEDTTSYIHRAGRTARFNASGEAILLLTKSQEDHMLHLLHQRNINVEKIEPDSNQLQDPHIKLECLVSSRVTLKDSAVLAFKHHLKSYALMKDKTLFDPFSINWDAFARSLGLAVTPRVRFLEKRAKQLKGKDEYEEEKGAKKLLTTLRFESTVSDDEKSTSDENDGLLISTREKHKLNDDKMEEITEMIKKEKNKKNKKKMKTREDIMKKELPFNQKVKFNKKGEPMVPTEVEQAVIGNRIDIEQMKERMKEEDRSDKKLQRKRTKEKRRLKLEEKRLAQLSDESGDEADAFTQKLIDELPDPDKLYNDKGETSDENDGKIEEEEVKWNRKEKKRKRIIKNVEEGKLVAQVIRPKKKKKKTSIKTTPDDSSEFLSQIAMEDKESLALMLLRGNR